MRPVIADGTGNRSRAGGGIARQSRSAAGEQRKNMRRGRKEQMAVTILWTAVLLLGWYICGILFPTLRQETVQNAVAGVQFCFRQAVRLAAKEGIPCLDFLTSGSWYTEYYEENGNLAEQTADWQDMAEASETQEAGSADTAKQEAAVPANQETEAAVPETHAAGTAEPAKQEVEETVSGIQAAETANPEGQAAQAAALPSGRLDWKSQIAPAVGWSAEQIADPAFLAQQLYVVSAGTSLPEQDFVPQELLEMPLTVSKTGEYQILIYHTHSQEAYADSVPGDVSQTVVGMGDLLTSCLEGYGYSVLHHRGIYDVTDGELDRNPAYIRALPVISSILEAHPEIQAVIDLHRDGVADDVRLVTEIDGKPTARIMYFNGLCRSETGEIEELSNPYRKENMAFSLQMALTTMAEYPGLTRCIYVRSNRYNQHLRGKSALIEVGAQTNTVDEVQNAIPILAGILNQVWSG